MKQSQSIWLVLIVVALVGGAFWFGATGGLSTAEKQQAPQGATVPSTSGVICANTLQTTMTINVRNGANTTGRDTYDNTFYVYKVGADGSESYYTSGSDTTSGSLTVDCGGKYRLRMVSTDGDEGDSQVINSVEAGAGIVSSDKRYVEFVASGAAMPLDLVSVQHGVLEFKAFDNLQNNFMYNTATASATAFSATGVNFTSTTGNTTATAVGASGKLDFEVQVETTQIDSQYFADGGYVLIAAPSATWDVASVYLDGNKLSAVALDSFESRLLGTTYQQYFKVPAGTVIDNQIHKVHVQINALSGVNPGVADSLQVALYDMGAARQTTGNNVRYSVATDASSPAAIYTAQIVKIAVS